MGNPSRGVRSSMACWFEPRQGKRRCGIDLLLLAALGGSPVLGFVTAIGAGRHVGSPTTTRAATLLELRSPNGVWAGTHTEDGNTAAILYDLTFDDDDEDGDDNYYDDADGNGYDNDDDDLVHLVEVCVVEEVLFTVEALLLWKSSLSSPSTASIMMSFYRCACRSSRQVLLLQCWWRRTGMRTSRRSLPWPYEVR